MGIEKKQKKEKEKKEEKLARTNKKLNGDMDWHIKNHNEKQNKEAQEEDERDFGKVKWKAKRFGKDTSKSCMIMIIVISFFFDKYDNSYFSNQLAAIYTYF